MATSTPQDTSQVLAQEQEGAIVNACSFRHVRFGVMRAYAKNNQYYINHNLRRNNLTKSRPDDLI
jgi:hypothetical protein